MATRHHHFVCDICECLAYRNYNHISVEIRVLCAFCEYRFKTADEPLFVAGWEDLYNFEQQMRANRAWFLWLDAWRNDNCNKALEAILENNPVKFWEIYDPYRCGHKNTVILREWYSEYIVKEQQEIERGFQCCLRTSGSGDQRVGRRESYHPSE